MIDTNASIAPKKLVFSFNDLVEAVGRMTACSIDPENVPVRELEVLSRDELFSFATRNSKEISKLKLEAILGLIVKKIGQENDFEKMLVAAKDALNELTHFAFRADLDRKDPMIADTKTKCLDIYREAFAEVIETNPIVAVRSYVDLNDEQLAREFSSRYDVSIKY